MKRHQLLNAGLKQHGRLERERVSEPDVTQMDANQDVVSLNYEY